MSFTIPVPTYIEISKFEYEYEFIYDGQALRTGAIARTTKLPDVKDIIRKVVDDYESRRDKNNFDKVNLFFTTPPITL